MRPARSDPARLHALVQVAQFAPDPGSSSNTLSNARCAHLFLCCCICFFFHCPQCRCFWMSFRFLNGWLIALMLLTGQFVFWTTRPAIRSNQMVRTVNKTGRASKWPSRKQKALCVCCRAIWSFLKPISFGQELHWDVCHFLNRGIDFNRPRRRLNRIKEEHFWLQTAPDSFRYPEQQIIRTWSSFCLTLHIHSLCRNFRAIFSHQQSGNRSFFGYNEPVFRFATLVVSFSFCQSLTPPTTSGLTAFLSCIWPSKYRFNDRFLPLAWSGIGQ